MPSIEFTQNNSGVGAGSSTLTITGHVITSATLDIVVIAVGAGNVVTRTISSVVRNSQSYSLVLAQDDGNFERLEIWKRDTPSVGTFNMVITAGGLFNQMGAGASGILDASLTLGTASGATGTSANPSVTVVDSANGDLVISGVANDNSATAQDPSTGTQIWEYENLESDSDFNAQYQTASGASTVCSWTNSTSGGGWSAAGVAIKAAGGGGDTVTWVGYIG